jgi:hypothetical protein
MARAKRERLQRLHINPMPPIYFDENDLRTFGQLWLAEIKSEKKKAESFKKKESMDFGKIVFDLKIGEALAVMLGGIPLVTLTPRNERLIAQEEHCVEVGPFKVVGGVRPQHFDVGYRPDGVRIAFDSKTLNEKDSIGKNWMNMINDLATEATSVHIRFPYAIVAFLLAIPKLLLKSPQKEAIAETLERMTLRASPIDAPHKAEAISLVVWNPVDGTIDSDWPIKTSDLRIEKFPDQIYKSYFERYKGLPPYDK